MNKDWWISQQKQWLVPNSSTTAVVQGQNGAFATPANEAKFWASMPGYLVKSK